MRGEFLRDGELLAGSYICSAIQMSLHGLTVKRRLHKIFGMTGRELNAVHTMRLGSSPGFTDRACANSMMLTRLMFRSPRSTPPT
jgi:hypothetical protein